jgi:dihydroanticapsin dehydrogenase
VKDGITVNAICPGPVHTLINDIRVQYDAQRLGKTFAEMETIMTPMGRRLEPEEIAPLAIYLASKESSPMTGQAINIDGGVLMVG